MSNIAESEAEGLHAYPHSLCLSRGGIAIWQELQQLLINVVGLDVFPALLLLCERTYIA